MKKFFSLVALLAVGFFIFTGQKDDGPRWSKFSTAVYPEGKYVRLPNQPDRFIKFSESPRYLNSPMGVTAVNPSFRVLPSTSTAQTELYLASNKANRNVMFGSSNNVTSSSINSGCFVTTDNGANWSGWQQINSGNTNDQRGDPGPVVDKNMRFVFSHLVSATNFGGLTGMGANYSTNFGANFSSTFMLETSANVDKNLSNTDDSPTSPYYGQSYTVWCNLGTPPASRFSRTTNGGVTWEPYVTLSNGLSGHYVQGHDVAAGPNGEVYATWVSNMNSGQYIADYLGFAKSTNGGVNFVSSDSAVNVNGARNSSFGGWSIRVNDFPRIDVDKSGGPRNGWIYIVMMEINNAPVAGSDEDVVIYRSSNQGTTWMPGVRVNQDAFNNGKRQFFPAVRVDDYGGVNVIYYDNRNFPNADSATVMISRSIDGGATFTDFEITDHHFKPKPATGMSGGYMGDYIGIAIGNNKVFGFWMDDKASSSTGFYNAWAASFDLGPSINHIPLTNSEQVSGTRPVNAVINAAGSGLVPSSAKLYYSKNDTALTLNVALTNTGGTNWSANLPLSGAGVYRYYLTVTDSLGRIATSPAGAPQNKYSFIAAPDTSKPVIVHTTLADVPKVSWPASVSANVTDNIGIDSVWVKWYKNNTSTGIKQFKLNSTGGSAYSAQFNSVNGDVQAGDSIFYRVFARDNSVAHNTDSTTLRNFKIIAQATACIGTGTTSTSYPYYTLYEDSRTQMMYKASEIITGGGGAGFISKLGFTILTVGSPAMNSFSVKMQTVSDTTLANWLSTGWTEVYTNSAYTPPGSGLQYIELAAPFYWNGTGSLVVEICFDNAAWSSNSTVAGTTQTNLVKHNHVDGSAGCTLTATSTASTRPNVCLVINTATGVNNQGTTVPQVYSLSQNYPNPFNPSTKINFAIPKQGLVTMKIYDVLGREVRTLVNEVKNAGNYTVDFNASELSSGVYFYKLESQGFSDIKKMMLIK